MQSWYSASSCVLVHFSIYVYASWRASLAAQVLGSTLLFSLSVQACLEPACLASSMAEDIAFAAQLQRICPCRCVKM